MDISTKPQPIFLCIPLYVFHLIYTLLSENEAKMSHFCFLCHIRHKVVPFPFKEFIITLPLSFSIIAFAKDNPISLLSLLEFFPL